MTGQPSIPVPAELVAEHFHSGPAHGPAVAGAFGSSSARRLQFVGRPTYCEPHETRGCDAMSGNKGVLASILHAGVFGSPVGLGLACVVGLFGMWRT
jgi:hypothetical protein